MKFLPSSGCILCTTPCVPCGHAKELSPAGDWDEICDWWRVEKSSDYDQKSFFYHMLHTLPLDNSFY
jgi:hypothetical protein